MQTITDPDDSTGSTVTSERTDHAMATKKKASNTGNDRQNALDAAMAMIEKDFGLSLIHI